MRPASTGRPPTGRRESLGEPSKGGSIAAGGGNLTAEEQEALLAKERDLKFKIWLQNKSIKEKGFEYLSKLDSSRATADDSLIEVGIAIAAIEKILANDEKKLAATTMKSSSGNNSAVLNDEGAGGEGDAANAKPKAKKTLKGAWMKWAMEFHSFSMLILSEQDLSTLSEAVKEFLFSEADLIASSGAEPEEINKASKTKNILPSLKYFFPAIPKPNEKPRPLTNDQKNQNLIFMRELKKLWKKAREEMNNRVIEYVAKGLKSGPGGGGGGMGRIEEEMMEKERRGKLSASNSFKSGSSGMGGGGGGMGFSSDDKVAQALEMQCLNELSLKRLKQWIEEDEDKKIAEENEDALNKLKEAKTSHEQFIRKKDGLRIRLPDEMEAPSTGGMSYGRDMSGLKANAKGVRTTVELMAGSGLKYVHATSKGRVGVPGDLEKSRAALLKQGHVLKENFDKDKQGEYLQEKANNPVILEKQMLEQKIKEDSVKAYEEWIQQKELREQALKCLALIQKPNVDYSQYQDDYLLNSSGVGLRNSTALRRSVMSTAELSRTSRRTSSGGAAAAAGPSTMAHFSLVNLLDHHQDELNHVLEVGRNLKKVDRTLFMDWMKWADHVIPTQIATILWDFFPPMACDVHSAAYSQLRDTFLKLLKPGRDYRETFVEFVEKAIFAKRIERIKESRKYYRLPDEEKEEVEKEILEMKQDWLKEVAITKTQFSDLLLTMGISLKPQELNSLFDAFDNNHDGVLTLVEFLDFCGPKRDKRSGNSMILNQKCCWLTTCKKTGMANGYSVSNPTTRLLKSQEEMTQKEKQTQLLTKFYHKDENKQAEEEEENYKLNSMKFTGKAVIKKLANGETRMCVELNERQKREDLLRKMGLLESTQKEKEGERSKSKGKDENYEDDYEDDHERYSDDGDHDDNRSKKSKTKDSRRSSKGGTGASEVCIDPCDWSLWNLKSRKEGLKFLLSITKEAREEELLKNLMSNGTAPNAPKFWVDTRRLAKNLQASRASRNEDQDFDFEDLSKHLVLHWSPAESTELISFYSIEYGGPVTSTVSKKNEPKYVEIYRDPEDAAADAGFAFSYIFGTHQSDPELTPGTSYRFRIRAFNGFGPSDYTYKTFTTLTTAPLLPRVTKLTADAVTLRWTFSKEFFERLEELKKLFQLADKDHSGQVDRNELTQVLDDKAADSQTLKRFLDQIAATLELDLSQGYGALFDRIEADDDGGLSWNEFQDFFMSVGWTSGGGSGGAGASQAQSVRGSTQSLATASNAMTVRPGDIVYVIEKCESEFENRFAEVLRTTLGSATVTRLEPGKSYRFRVFSLNADEIPGPASETVVVHTLLETPAAPTVVPKTVKSKSLTITWKARNYMTNTRHQAFIDKMVGDWAHSHGDKDGGVDIQGIFQKYDRDNSGNIDRTELAVVLEDLGVPVTEERLTLAFQEMDANNDGNISFEEFSKWWLGEAVSYVLKRSEEVPPKNRFVGAGSEKAGGAGGDDRRSSSRGKMTTIPEEASLNRSQASQQPKPQPSTMKMTTSRANSLVKKAPGRQVGLPFVVYRDNKTKVDVKGLTPNSLYHFKVRYVGTRSNSLLSPPLIIMTAPIAPSAPALIDLSWNTVRVKWYPSEYGAYKFIVHLRPSQQIVGNNSTRSARATAATIVGVDTGEDGWIQVYNGPDNFYTCTTLSTDFTYELRVFSVNYQGNMSEPSPSLLFTTLSRNDNSSVINSKSVSALFTVECTGDICVGDTILITERLFLRPKVGGGGGVGEEKVGGGGSVVSARGGGGGGGGGASTARPLSRGKQRPSSASATGSRANNPLGNSVASLHTTMTVENDGFISIHPSNNAQFIGERTFAAIVTKDNYRTSRDVLESRGITLQSNYKEFASYRKLWLEIVWQKSSNEAAKQYELKSGEILERFQNHLELFEVFRCPWKQEPLRKPFTQEWDLLRDCFIDMD